MKKFLAILFFVAINLTAFSQDSGSNCAQTLRLAQSVYDQGRLHELEDIINKGLASGGCDQQTTVNLYKLLTLAYIYLEEPAKADASMLKLLETDHYFEINPAVDPAEFVALYNTFRTKPIYRIGAKLGVNASRPNVVETVTAVELSPDSGYKYSIAILFGGVVDVPVNDRMTLHGELLYLQRKFELDLNVERGLDDAGNPVTNSFEGFETQNWLSLPLGFEYKFLEKKYNPYIMGGFSIDYLLGAELSSLKTRDEAASIPATTFDLKPIREKINLSAMVGTGIKLKMGGGYFVAEVRFIYGLTNVNSSRTAFSNEQATWDQSYADPIFKVSSLALSGSYVINIFKPKKK